MVKLNGSNICEFSLHSIFKDATPLSHSHTSNFTWTKVRNRQTSTKSWCGHVSSDRVFIAAALKNWKLHIRVWVSHCCSSVGRPAVSSHVPVWPQALSPLGCQRPWCTLATHQPASGTWFPRGISVAGMWLRALKSVWQTFALLWSCAT